MARISSYNLDTSVSKTDKVIGTDSSGNTTKNFNLEKIAGFLNTSSLINVNGQLIYKFVSGQTPGNGEFVKANGTSAFSTITSFLFSHVNTNEQNIQTYLNYFEDLNVMLTQTDDQNNFALYTFNSITDSFSGYSTISVTFIEGNGTLTANKFYAMSYSPKNQTDKHFVQSYSFSANTSQSVNHNLNKHPAVTVVDSAGTHVVGDVQHINENQFNITFTSSFSGTVYAN